MYVEQTTVNMISCICEGNSFKRDQLSSKVTSVYFICFAQGSLATYLGSKYKAKQKVKGTSEQCQKHFNR